MNERRPTILTLREYESATIGPEWSPARKMVSGRLAEQIDSIQSNTGQEALTVLRRSLKAKHYVGTVGVDGHAIEVLPKIDSDEPVVRRNLVEMLARARIVPLIEGGVTSLSPSAPVSLIDGYMQIYVRELAREWRRGPIRDYRKNEQNRTWLKGKLVFSEQMRRNLLRPDRFYTRADELQEDVPLSRVLKAAVDVCRLCAISPAVQRQANELLADFGRVEDEYFDRASLDRVQVDRSTERFGPLVTLAKLLLSGRTVDRPGGDRTYSLLFDMNIVFERYIADVLRTQVCPPGQSADSQVSTRSLVRRGNRAKFRLRPDVEISEAGHRVCLVDTKWKRLDRTKPHNGVSQADMYQAYAYGKEYGVPTVMLLYPDPGGWPREVAVYRHNPGDDQCPQIVIATVNLGGADLGHRVDGVAAQLRGLVPQRAAA